MSGSVLLVHGLSGQLLGNHVSKDTHLGGTAVVELYVQLAGLFFGVSDVGTEVTNTVVSIVLGGRHPGQFDKGEEGEDLRKSGSGDSSDTVSSGWDVRELQVVGGGQVSIEDDVVVVDNHTNNSSHGNTSVLALDGSATFEGLGLSLQPSQRIVDTKGFGDSELQL